jgi:hypothetical protein
MSGWFGGGYSLGNRTDWLIRVDKVYKYTRPRLQTSDSEADIVWAIGRTG